jgi:hypothetical protein
MRRTLKTSVKDDKGNSATLFFNYAGGGLWVNSDDFQLASTDGKQPSEPQLMQVRRFPVHEQRHGGSASIVGIRSGYHLGYVDPSFRRSLLRSFRRLVQTKLDNPSFAKRLRDWVTVCAYHESVDAVRQTEKELKEFKAQRLAILQQMVANKKLKAQPVKLPLIK